MSKIIFLSYDYPPNNGGIARLCYEIKKQFEINNIAITVVTLANNGTDLENDKNVIRITGKRGILEWNIFQYLKTKTAKDDIILTGIFHPEGLLSLLSGRKTFMLAHGAELLKGKSFFRIYLWKWYRNIVLKHANMVIANSHYTANLVRKCSPKANVVAIPLCVDTNYFKPTAQKYNDGSLHLCSISRLEKFKGQDFIINTIASLPPQYKDRIRLTIGGKGSYKHTLEQQVKDLNLSDIISFIGFIPDEKLCDIYSSHDIYILCTREEPEEKNVEGFGLTFAEAQSCGTAAIGTACGGISDAIENGNGGWLIKQDDRKELFDLLIHLIDNQDIVKKEGTKARDRMKKNYSWNIYYKKLSHYVKKD